MKPIYLSTTEVKALKAEGKVTLVRRLKEQPPDGYELTHQENGYAYFIEYIYVGGFAGYKQSLPWFSKFCYPVGAEFAGKETWGNHAYGYTYKADGGDAGGIIEADGCTRYGWQSSATQPSEAVRPMFRNLTVTSNRVDKQDGVYCEIFTVEINFDA